MSFNSQLSFGVSSALIISGTITNANISPSAGISTSKISGLATSATTDTTNATNISSGALAASRMPAFTGDITTSAGAIATTLATVNSNVGTFGSSTLVPVITVNAKGLVTGVTTSSISGALTFTGDVTGSGTTGSNTALSITALAVTNAMLAGSIANAKLVNSSVTVGTTAIALGASSTTLVGLTSVTSTGFTGALTGNASTATTLETARAIQGVNFDGSAAITVVTAGTGVSVSGTAVSIGQAVGTTDNVTFNNVTVSGTLTSDDITSTNISVAGNATITGDLTVSGTTTTINSTTIAIADLNLELARNATTAAAANGAGITVTGPVTPATFTYTSADDRWNLNKNLNVTTVFGALSGNASTATALATSRTIAVTGDITYTSGSFDGTGNVTGAATLATVNANVGAFGSSTLVPVITVNAKGLVTAVSTASISGSISVTGGDLTLSGTTGTAITDATLATVNANVGTFTKLTVNAKGLVTAASAATTTDIGEGTNLYYTDTRARAAHSFTAGSGAYNSSTGVITIPTNNNQLTNGAGYITGYTETDTLATVTGRGATTTIASTFNGGITVKDSMSASTTNAGGNFNLFSNLTGFQSLTIAGGNLITGTDKYVYVGTGTNHASSTTTVEISSSTSGSLTKVWSPLTVVGTITGSNLSGTNTGDNAGVTSVSGTAPVASSGGTTPAISMAAASSGVNGYMTGAYATKLDGIAAGATNVTNTNQLTNGAGYITSAGNAATATSATNLYGAGGSYIASSTGGTSYSNAIQVREAGLGGAQGSAIAYAPRLGFHWSGVVASSIVMEASGRIGIVSNPGTSYEAFVCGTLTASNFSGTSSGTNTGDQTDVAGYSNYVNRVTNYQWLNATLPTGYNSGLETSFVSAAEGWPNYGVVLSVMGRIPGDPGGNFQLYMGHGSSYGGLGLRVRSINQSGNVWTSWKILLDETNYTSYAMPAGSSATNSVDVRAPIFYDSNDTSYYVDPASTSRFVSTIVGGHGGNSYDTASTGRLWFGTTAQGESYSIYTAMENVGGNYTKLTLDWHTGIRIGAYAGYGGVRFYNNSISSSGSKIFSVGELDSNVRVYNDIRSPLFYDLDDTTYYGDFASTSWLRHLSVGDINATNDGSWNARLNLTGSSHARLDVKSNSDGIITTMYSHTGQGVGRVGTYSNHPLVLMAQGGVDGGYVYSGSLRSPIFYDSNDTAYYVDPNSTSVFNRLLINQRNDNYNVGSMNPTNPVSDWQSLTNTEGQFTVSQYNAIGNYTNTPPNVYTYGSVLSWRTANHSFQLYAAHTGDITFKTQWNNDNSSGWRRILHEVNYTSFAMPIGSSATNSVDIRAPIFYDSNDTGYYVNPNSFSQMSYGNFNAAPSGRTLSLGGDQTDRVYNDAARSSLVINATYYPHLYLNATTNNGNEHHGAVFSMTGNLSAGGYRRWSIGIANTNPDCFSWGYADNNTNPHYGVGGTFGYTGTPNIRMWLNTGGALMTSGDMRAPIFYDSNDTGYYVNPSASGGIALRTVGEIQFNNNAGTTTHFNYSNGASSNYIRGTTYFDGNTVQFSSGNLRWNGYAYDNDDTAYYVDPNGTSVFNILSDPALSDSKLYLRSKGDTNHYLWNNASDFEEMVYYTGTGFRVTSSVGTQTALFSETGITAGSSMRAPIFYDSNDTSYYTDPASTSNLNAIRLASNNALYFSTTSTAQFEHDSNSTPVAFAMIKSGSSFADGDNFGVLNLRRLNHNNGATTAGASLFYELKDSGGTVREYAGITGRKTEAGAAGGQLDFHYYGRSVMANMNSSLFQHITSVRAPIFYDLDDTGYYVNPNSESNLLYFSNATKARAGLNIHHLDRSAITGDTNYWVGTQGWTSSPGWNAGFTQLGSCFMDFWGSDTGHPQGNVHAQGLQVLHYRSGSAAYGFQLVSGGDTSPRMWTRKAWGGGGSTWYELALRSATVSGEFYATTYYDADNTAFYLDPNATGTSLNVAGAIIAAGNITAYSDIRLKEDIEVITNAIDKVKQINGITYTRKENGKRQTGVIAQDVLKVLPEAVEGSNDSMYSVAYGNMVGLLVEAIKEQQIQIEELKTEMKAMKNKSSL